MKNFLVLITLSLMLASCSFTLTRKEPYRSYLNKPLTLKREVVLYDLKSGPVTFWSGGKKLKSGKLYQMSENPKVWETDFMHREYYQSIKAQPGTGLIIQNIYYFQSDGGYEVRVFGKIFVETLGRNVPFLYIWPLVDHAIVRAPWDDDSVPAKR